MLEPKPTREYIISRLKDNLCFNLTDPKSMQKDIIFQTKGPQKDVIPWLNIMQNNTIFGMEYPQKEIIMQNLTLPKMRPPRNIQQRAKISTELYFNQDKFYVERNYL